MKPGLNKYSMTYRDRVKTNLYCQISKYWCLYWLSRIYLDSSSVTMQDLTTSKKRKSIVSVSKSRQRKWVVEKKTITKETSNWQY